MGSDSIETHGLLGVGYWAFQSSLTPFDAPERGQAGIPNGKGAASRTKGMNG
jgi:hypothetical protein